MDIEPLKHETTPIKLRDFLGEHRRVWVLQQIRHGNESAETTAHGTVFAKVEQGPPNRSQVVFGWDGGGLTMLLDTVGGVGVDPRVAWFFGGQIRMEVKDDE